MMVRVGKGRKDFKAIYAEMPNTSMSQDDGASRKTWQKTAHAELNKNVAVEIQKALDGVVGPSPGSVGGE